MTGEAPPAVAELLASAVAARVTPGGVIAVGASTADSYIVACGAHSYAADAAAVSSASVYDLASLTKVLATLPLALRAATTGELPLNTRVAPLVPGLGVDVGITVQDLLEHAAGYAAHQPFYQRGAGAAAYRRLMAAERAVYPPRSTHRYSDLGFILLALLLDDATGVPFARAFDTLREEIAPGAEVTFGVPHSWRHRVVPTGVDLWRGRVIHGHVHDANAAALGGVAGHAGLFGTAASVGSCARWWLRMLHGDASAAGITRALVRRAVSRGEVPGSSRGLGWDTMLPTSSCGTRLSPKAFGHTGFTGTSLWIDPARDLYVVLLTNRIHAADDPRGIRALRIAVHEAVADAWDASTHDKS